MFSFTPRLPYLADSDYFESALSRLFRYVDQVDVTLKEGHHQALAVDVTETVADIIVRENSDLFQNYQSRPDWGILSVRTTVRKL